MVKTTLLTVIMMLGIVVSAWAVAGGDVYQNSPQSESSSIAIAGASADASAAVKTDVDMSAWMQTVQNTSMFNAIKDGDTKNVTKVDVGGDTVKTKVYSAGSLTTAEGTSGFNAGSIFGSLAVGNTEGYKKLNSVVGMLKTMVDTELMSETDLKTKTLVSGIQTSILSHCRRIKI